ncbi:uncharacterized protein F5Z01DRAFT_754455 [Emericellopsis atlantica]|uniref:WSC domain-containing protein n=1 Tax=Emericellopsis atlantica TaxID=2614577 RepID=A0A9P8CLD5_9HYPO|nr:uncharacterized protein F5Z01DRAFT_754455 [Emericellopsis atlantica]KAG9249496.1 hypothetical protein F5Z01DRAFT_754455 [Emericellopsis atlantica]
MNSMHFTALAKFLAFLVAARPVVARGYHPGLQWDPEPALPCITWYDNAEGESCEEVRDYWNITPEEFTKWNPSVGLDCKPWRYQSQDGGDDNLIIADCQETCYQEAFIFAGVKAGNECCCSTYIAGGRTNNATAEFNSPGTGDDKVNCGGKDRVDSQTAGDGSAEQESDEAEAEPSQSSSASEDSVVQEDDAESGASMNRAMFIRGFLD